MQTLQRDLFISEIVSQREKFADEGLMGFVEQIVSLLLTGLTNDSQIKTLFNYILQTGDAPRFSEFIRGVAERSPHCSYHAGRRHRGQHGTKNYPTFR